jgi:D-aminoacyl-tRNA deacylase
MGKGRPDLKTVIVCSANDPAGTNIRDRLLEKFPFHETDELFQNSKIYSWSDLFVVSSSKDIVFVDGLDEQFGESRCVFISRHRAESGIPSLTAHFTGNYGENSFGGNPREIARFSPSLLKNYFIELSSRRETIPAAYNVTLEATHHGPSSLKSPLIFVELGSSERQWVDAKAASEIADALMKAVQSKRTFNKCAVAIGGTHYSEKFNAVELGSEIALGPTVPKYALEHFDRGILDQILRKGDQPIRSALIDAKGLGKHKESVLKLIEETGLELIKA